jgi:hypothetical protein
MKLFLLGIALLIAGILLMDVNFYLGMAVMGVGVVLVARFKGDVMAAQRRKAMQRIEEARLKSEQRRREAK